ncbi:hypothetical protein [Arenibacter latericius]|uniref:hypothetical protein n=1 Tax=Arenibacter latericius TaxID=86104 RepID=UPI0004278B2F|nr:hypothetical protein [Arenibacter latericius]
MLDSSQSFTLPFSLLLFCFSLGIQSQQLKVGAAMRNITPDPLIAVSGGVDTPKPANVKKGELTVRAMVLEKAGERIAIVNIDNLGWPAVLGNRSKAMIKGISPENIVIGATHTHSAPDAYAFPDKSGKSAADMAYLDWCVVQTANAVNEAIENLEPAYLKIAVGEAKGKIAYNYYAPQLYDPRCGIIQALGSNGKNKDKPIVTLINYAIHPEVIGSNQGILSPDLIGPLYNRITSKTKGLAVFMNGAQGGMVTADNRLDKGNEANDWEECNRIGNLLADEALRLLADAKPQRDPQIFAQSKQVIFPIESEMMRFILNNSPLSIGTSDKNKISTTITLLNIGTAQVLTIPGEALPNIGYYLKRKMPTDHSFLFGLTNDAFGYILTKEDYNSFKRYEYITKTSLGEMTGEILVTELLELINKSPIPDSIKTYSSN